MRSSTRTHTHPPNHPPTHTTAIIKDNDSVRSSKAFHSVEKEHQQHTFRLGDIRLVFLRLRLLPSRGHPSHGHPSRRHPSRWHQSQGYPSRGRPSLRLERPRRMAQTDAKTTTKPVLIHNFVNRMATIKKIQSISHQNTCSFSHPLLHTHRYTPSQPQSTHTHTTAGINMTRTSLDPYTPLKANVPEMERHEDRGPIRLSFPSQGHPPVPSVRAIRLGDIPLGLPSRGHPSNQVIEI